MDRFLGVACKTGVHGKVQAQLNGMPMNALLFGTGSKGLYLSRIILSRGGNGGMIRSFWREVDNEA